MMLHQVALVALFCVQTLANPGCGVPRSKHQALIVRGSPTQPGEWPWHAGVYHRSGRNSQYACGGTLISAEFVVTAAHCMLDEGTSYRLTRKRLFVRLGVHNLDRIDPGAMQQFTIADIHMFGNFSRDNLHNDIALLELGEMVRMTDYVVPACVNRNVNLDGLAGTAVGWGVTEDDEISLELKQVTLPVIDSVDCLESDRDLFGTMMHKGMFCAGYQNGSSVCNGDSGGGMFFNRDGMWYLGGIVSFQKFRKHGTNLCYTRGYAAFTNVAKYLDWMGNITGMDFSERPAVLVTTTEAPKKRERVPCSPRVSDKSML
ncbi:polyserase-2 [Culex quinquefasciatus]|uniref:Polyserase-2 n=1 Tax=Culex quinquefasciatus TaxID=7176 RepID=B0XHR9_CULQU|nr:polyserase-2 [Culex quinquefasciatus]|eukprot:XP_001869191.1 polyserase-2 [Culex quinquefasciatus]